MFSRSRRRFAAARTVAVEVSTEQLETRQLLTTVLKPFANVNLTNPWGAVKETVTVGNDFYFVASESNSRSLDLWKSDGTTAGTIRLSSLGPADGQPNHLTNVNGTLYFRGYDEQEGHELWKSDGSPETTQIVRSFKAGPKSTRLTDFINHNGTLIFSANGELCRSNGTAQTTYRAVDLIVGDSDEISQLERVGRSIFFTAKNSVGGEDLYRTNGTRLGTWQLGSVPAGDLTNLTKVGTSLFLVRNGHQLWKTSSDHTTASIVKSFEDYVSLDQLTDVNGTLFIVSQYTELVRSDGTEAGTVSVREIGDSVSNLFAWNGVLYFGGGVRYQGAGEELWRSDGTTSGTFLLKDINPLFNEGYGYGSYPQLFTERNGQLFFFADNGLWQTDGTSSGTVRVDQQAAAAPMQNAGGTLFYFRSSAAGQQLRKLPTGSTEPSDVVRNGPGTGNSNPSTPVLYNGAWYFSADDSISGQELRRRNSDGTVELVSDITPGLAGTSIRNLTSLNGLLYFSASSATDSESLWRSDGTEAGTFKLANVTVMHSGSTEKSPRLVSVGSQIFFAGKDAHGIELWKTDGTITGTVLVKDIFPGSYTGEYGSFPNSSSPTELTSLYGRLYFAATDATGGRELWRSNGTAGGTRLVQDLQPGNSEDYPYIPLSSNPSGLAVSRNTLYFTTMGPRGVTYYHLQPQLDAINSSYYPNANLVYARSFVQTKYGLFHVGINRTGGTELWIKDGPQFTYRLVKQIRQGSGSADIRNMFAADGILYFTADDGVHGRELWRSDGTANGTYMVSDIRQSADNGRPGSSSPDDFTFLNGVLFFTADDGAGRELWRTNGTHSGVTKLTGLTPGVVATRPTGLSAHGNTVYFAGHSNVGRELMQLWSPPPVLTVPSTSLVFTENDSPLALAANATLKDADSPDLVGGYVMVTLANPLPGDQLQVSSNSLVRQTGNFIETDGAVFATVSARSIPMSWVYDLNQNASLKRVEKLIQSLEFYNGSRTQRSGLRRIRLQVADGTGGITSRFVEVQVNAINDPPVINGLTPVTYTRNGAKAVAIAPNADFIDDNFFLTGNRLIISVTGGEPDKNRLTISKAVDANNNILSGNTIIGTINANAGIGGVPVIITWNANARPSRNTELLRNLMFSTTGSTSNETRVVTYTYEDLSDPLLNFMEQSTILVVS